MTWPSCSATRESAGGAGRSGDLFRYHLFRAAVQIIKPFAAHHVKLEDHGDNDHHHQVQGQDAGHVEAHGGRTDSAVYGIGKGGEGVHRRYGGRHAVISHRIHENQHGRGEVRGHAQGQLDAGPCLKEGGPV